MTAVDDQFRDFRFEVEGGVDLGEGHEVLRQPATVDEDLAGLFGSVGHDVGAAVRGEECPVFLFSVTIGRGRIELQPVKDGEVDVLGPARANFVPAQPVEQFDGPAGSSEQDGSGESAEVRPDDVDFLHGRFSIPENGFCGDLVL